MNETRKKKLIQKYLDYTLSRVERSELSDWYDEVNFKSNLWEMRDQSEIDRIETRTRNNILKYISRKKGHSLFQIRYVRTIAACLCVAVAGLVCWYLGQNLHNSTVLLADSHNRLVILPDSSKVVLKAGSRLEVNFGEETRSLKLIGEAFFDVVKNKKRPFVVLSGPYTTTVLGTEFSVKSGANEVSVAVRAGKVAVKDHRTNHHIAVLTPNQGLKITDKSLKKGENSRQVYLMDQKYVHQQQMWISADMNFTNTALSTVVDRLEKRFGVQIKICDPELNSRKIMAQFSATDSLDVVLRTLTQIMGASYAEKSGSYEIKKDDLDPKYF